MASAVAPNERRRSRDAEPRWVQDDRINAAKAKRIRRAAKPGASKYARNNVR